MHLFRTLPLALAAVASPIAATAAEWDQTFKAPNVTNLAYAIVEGPGVSAFVFERVTGDNADPADDRVILRRIDRATTQVFAVTLDADLFPETMAAGATRVCASFASPTTAGVQCFSAATGARTLNFTSGRTDVGYEIWEVLNDVVRVTEFSADPNPTSNRPNARVLDIAANGTAREVVVLPERTNDRLGSSNDNGAFLRVSGGPLVATPGDESYFLYDASGTQRGNAIPSPFNQTTQRSRTIVLPDGSAAVLGRTRGGISGIPAVWSLLRISENGQVLWLREFPGQVGYPQIQFTGQELIISYGSFPALLPGDQDPTREDVPLNAVLISVNPQTGAENWRTTFPSAVAGPYLVEGRGNEILHALQIRSGVYLRRFNRTTGQLIATDRRSCGSTYCETQAMWIDGEGGLQLGVNYPIDQGRERWAILRENDPFGAVVGQYEIGSPALEGAWFNPTTSGQGLVIDQLAGSNILFATWFTHVVNPAVAGADGLRWFTIQGTQSGGTQAGNLGIFQNAGGQFATGATTAARIGTARFIALDCNTLRLEYDFDAATGIPDGVTTLVRATPATVGCALPYVPFIAPRNGFDIAQTGHWFAPNAAGQGFSFVVAPATATANGSFLGAWFTFDATSDDPRSQHWFTLSGAITPSTANGRVETTIFRSTGGAFETQPALNVDAVGTATVTFLSCSTARVEYRFDADAGTGFGGRTGTIDLVGEACN